jgi:hypothetical protein
VSFLPVLSRGLHPLGDRGLARIEQDVQDEIRFYLEMRAAEQVAEDMSPDSARAEARRRFGDVDTIAEACVQEQISAPVRTALRSVETAVLLAVGLAFLASILVLVDSVLFSPPAAFGDEGRRVGIWWNDAHGRSHSGSTFDEFAALRSMDDVFEQVTLSRYRKVHFRRPGHAPEQVRVKYVTANYFELLGTRPTVGRGFAPDEVETRARPVAVLAHDLWQGQFGGDPRAVGEIVEVNGRPHTVVGVMPPNVHMYLETGLFVPMAFPVEAANDRTLLASARLRPGIAHDQVHERVSEIAAPGLQARVRTLRTSTTPS